MRPGARLLVLGLLAVLAALAGCSDPQGPEPGDDRPGNETAEPRTTIAWTAVPSPDEVPDPDPDRLGDLLARQVYENGTAGEPRYRTPGTQGHADTIPILADALAGAADRVERETFPVELPCLGTVEATNLHGIREGSQAQREIWLAAHWDSRAWADQAEDESRREEPVLGANDGAAAVAVATHALEILPETNATVRTVLFDAEDQGASPSMPCEPTPEQRQPHGGWIQGSLHAAENRTADELARIEALLLVDMPGHEELSIKREGHSHAEAGTLTDLTFGVAERLDASSFRNETGPAITDDHLPFLERNVSAVDIIHLDDEGAPFPWTWHTPHDTPQHVSNASMAEVTEVLAGTAMAVDRGALPPDG